MQLRVSETKKLVNLHYLSLGDDGKFHVKEKEVLKTDEIRIRETGIQLAKLMDFKLTPLEEIARAFGTGMIRTTLTYSSSFFIEKFAP